MEDMVGMVVEMVVEMVVGMVGMVGLLVPSTRGGWMCCLRRRTMR